MEGGSWYFFGLLAAGLAWLVILIILAKRLSWLHLNAVHLLVGLLMSAAFVAPIQATAKNEAPASLLVSKLGIWLDQGGLYFLVAWLVLGGALSALGKAISRRRMKS